MSDLVGNPEDRFSQNEALMCYSFLCFKDCKYNSVLKADTMDIKATDLYVEPLATLLMVGSGVSTAGDAQVDGAGGGHASPGGGGMLCSRQFENSDHILKTWVYMIPVMRKLAFFFHNRNKKKHRSAAR